MAETEAFDLHRMFIGDFSWLLTLEIIVRTSIMYVYALLAVRFIGKRGSGNLSPFEYVLVFTIGSAAGDPMFYPEVPLLHGMVVIAMVVLLEKGVLQLTKRNEPAERFLESSPACVVSGGTINHDRLRSEDLSLAELLMKLRLNGVTNVGQVRYAYLEPNGDLSVFRLEEHERVPGMSTLVADA